MIELPRPDFNNCQVFSTSIDETPKVKQKNMIEIDLENDSEEVKI